MAALEEVVYELAKDALGEQESQIDDLRRRAGPLLAAGAAVAALLADAAIGGGLRLNDVDAVLQALAFIVGVVGALGAFGAAVYVLLSRDDMKFSIDAPRLYAYLFAQRNDPAVYYRRLAEALRERRRLNEKAVSKMHDVFTFGLAGLGCEVVGFLAATALA